MTEDLPEYMSEAEFKRRFGGVDAMAYKQLLSDISNAAGFYQPTSSTVDCYRSKAY
jgi:hypothetical protein